MCCSAGASRSGPTWTSSSPCPRLRSPPGGHRLHPDRHGTAYFAAIEGGAFAHVQQEVRALLTADSERGGSPVEFSRDTYGYSWLLSRRPPDDLPALVSDLHAVNTSLQDSDFGPHLLCSLVAFHDAELRPLALVYLSKRDTFHPFAPLLANTRDNPLELWVKTVLKDDLRIEQDLSRWFPLWGAPGL
ncbi:PspA-associated protein PspAB [Streptomyces sp. enrichment culture]|uniref:PspA-associated protein PspAB n=1 Tax=Streptomyces sp. enrichment culture TaxID=1795815 RepID=UPI003F55811B